MKSLSRIVQVALLTITAVVLVINARYLYTAPVANSFNWWQGDETWLMAESNHFAATGHYINPLAPGSAYSECSGLLFGSCYLTATLYGLPLILVKSHAIDTGRTITWLFGVLTIFAGMDGPASSALTQQRLGWRPTQSTGLIADLDQFNEFRV